MEITFNTPAVLFPAISLLMLAYTNRFLALANLIRKLHEEYLQGKNEKTILLQIVSLRRRLYYVRWMQGLGVFSFLICVCTMYCIYSGWQVFAQGLFALSLISLSISLVFSLVEIIQSTKALELELSDIQGLGEDEILTELWKRYKNRNKKRPDNDRAL
ncbi:MAG: DUF2721 domain-containing protein [Saprospiraceae bacterium]